MSESDAALLLKLADELAEEASDCAQDAPRHAPLMADFLDNTAKILRLIADRIGEK